MLLAHALERSRGWLYAYPEYVPTAPERARWRVCLAQRLARRPLAYIVGRKEFMGLPFRVDERVLIPRPETELLVELAAAWIERKATGSAVVADVGTGSGCIALSLTHRCPALKAWALDIDPAALQVARANAAHLALERRVIFRAGDLLAALPEKAHLILANLPYVAPAEYAALTPEIRDFEPVSALVSRGAGLQHILRLAAMLPGYLVQGGAVILECAPRQAVAIQSALSRAGRFAAVTRHRDLAGWTRCVAGWDFRLPPV